MSNNVEWKKKSNLKNKRRKCSRFQGKTQFHTVSNSKLSRFK